jgi:hypothetical protein
MAMIGGHRTAAGTATLAEARDHARRQLAEIPPYLSSIDRVEAPYKIVVSKALQRKIDAVRQQLLAKPKQISGSAGARHSRGGTVRWW